MQQNNISIVITPVQEAAIMAKADELRALLAPFVISLTDEERASIFKLGDARLAFDTKASDYIHARPDLVPDSIDVAEYDKDGAAWAVINRVIAKLSTVVGELTDTSLKLGSDRLDAALIFLRLPRLCRPHRSRRRRRHPRRPQDHLPRPPHRPHPRDSAHASHALSPRPVPVIHCAQSIVDDGKGTTDGAPGVVSEAESTPMMLGRP